LRCTALSVASTKFPPALAARRVLWCKGATTAEEACAPGQRPRRSTGEGESPPTAGSGRKAAHKAPVRERPRLALATRRGKTQAGRGRVERRGRAGRRVGRCSAGPPRPAREGPDLAGLAAGAA
jgi:hypothetical protein